MEDNSVWEWERDRQVYIGVFDGHGGKEASEYMAHHLWTNIQCARFKSCESDEAKKAIVDGFKNTHEDMWAVRGKELVAI